MTEGLHAESPLDKAGVLAIPQHRLIPPNRHMPGLDVVRGLAIASVLFFHGIYQANTSFAPKLPLYFRNLMELFSFGNMGVELFFVLSGFLITGILLDTRENSNYYKTFYMRRILRILPVYLLMILILRISAYISWAFVLVSLLYAVNMTISSVRGGTYPAFWSLSVEEQFYLVWPVCVRKLRPRHTFYLALFLVIATPLLRYVLQGVPRFDDIIFKPWAVADFFAGGGVMAMLIRSSRTIEWLPRICIATFAAAGVLFTLWYSIRHMHQSSTMRALRATEMSPWVLLFSASVLMSYLLPNISANIVGRFFAFLGYISYGLYLCHPLIQSVIERRWTMLSLDGNFLVIGITARFFVIMGLAVGISYLSRRTFEEYFLKLKPRQRETVHDLRLVQ
jgi:peptidoglycan/LPS O-acetylase OafA/YrhL